MDQAASTVSATTLSSRRLEFLPRSRRSRAVIPFRTPPTARNNSRNSSGQGLCSAIHCARGSLLSPKFCCSETSFSLDIHAMSQSNPSRYQRIQTLRARNHVFFGRTSPFECPDLKKSQPLSVHRRHLPHAGGGCKIFCVNVPRGGKLRRYATTHARGQGVP